MDNFRKILIKVLLVIILFAVFVGVIERDVIFQEGNPLPVITGILRITLIEGQIAQISDEPEKYIVKKKDGYEPFIRLMKKNGWTYIEQMGAGLVFEKDGEKHISVSRMLTRFYIVIRY